MQDSVQIEAKKLNFIYGEGTAFEQYAIKDVSFTIKKGEFVGVIGHTGSGKSTLIQHLNGLIKATSGELFFNGENIYTAKYDMKLLRQKVGLVFQYPEHQLFEVDVLSDVEFGPRNQKLSEEVVEARAKESLALVGLGETTIYYQDLTLGLDWTLTLLVLNWHMTIYNVVFFKVHVELVKDFL